MKTRTHLESLPPYTPIEPFEVLSARLGRSPDQIVKLDANENPYGPLKAVREALAEMEFPHIYPDPESRALREALARFTGLDTEYLLAGAGAGFFLHPFLKTPHKSAPHDLQSLRLNSEGLGLDIMGDRFVLHTRDKEGKKGIDLKL
jgi:hypothetical protein